MSNTDYLIDYAAGADHRMRGFDRLIDRLGLLDVPKHARIVDLCCGHGEFLAAMRQRGYSRLVGVDVAGPTEPPDGVEIIKGSATSSHGLRADVVTIFYSLHHMSVADVRATIEQAWRMLGDGDGGELIIVDWWPTVRSRIAFEVVGWFPTWLGRLLRSERGDVRRWFRDGRSYMHAISSVTQHAASDSLSVGAVYFTRRLRRGMP